MLENLRPLHLNACRLLIIAIACIASVRTEAVPAASGNAILKKFPVKASQGVAVDEKWFYAISDTSISKHDKETGERIAEWRADRNPQSGDRFKHLNSGTVVGSKLYCAHSRFPLDPNHCTVEVFEVGARSLEHETTIPLPRVHGSLTWIDRRGDGSWWMCYAVYGKRSNQKTKLIKYRRDGGKFVELREWFFPDKVVAQWGRMSCSGGSWGPDDKLYITGHDRAQSYVLSVGRDQQLRYLRTEKGLGLSGQAIAWDRFSEKPVLWGIVRNRYIAKTYIPAK